MRTHSIGAKNKPIVLDNQFRPADYPLEHRSFVIVVVGRNNGAWVSKTLHSVFSQNYTHYRLVYIDDASDDGSFDLAKDLINANLSGATLVKNEESLGTLANLVRAIQSCQDEEIVVVLNGEDWLAHEWVLQRLNAYYANPDLWMTYGQAVSFPSFQPGPCRPFLLQDLKEGGFRSHPFVSSHLKTFYAALFNRINETDLIYQGQFLAAATDAAYMIPMLEMAKEHFQFIPEVFYISNQEALFREDMEGNLRCEKFVRSLQPYPSLASLQLNGAK